MGRLTSGSSSGSTYLLDGFCRKEQDHVCIVEKIRAGVLSCP